LKKLLSSGKKELPTIKKLEQMLVNPVEAEKEESVFEFI